MSKNTSEVQGNQTFVLHFDRVDLLRKQLDDLISIIENTQSLHYINDLRDKIVMTLGEITESQRLKINGVFRDAGIFEKISNKQTILRQQVVQLRRDAPVKKPKHHNKYMSGSRHAENPKATLDNKAPEGKPLSLSYGSVTVYAVERVKIVNERDKKGNLVEKEKIFIQVTGIIGGEMPKVHIGGVYSVDSLPIPLRFAYIPGLEEEYKKQQAIKEAAELEAKRALRHEKAKKDKGKKEKKEKCKAA